MHNLNTRTSLSSLEIQVEYELYENKCIKRKIIQ